MPEKIIICLAADDRYAAYMGMAIFSILKNARQNDQFRFYILDNKISDENKTKIASLQDIRPFEITYLPLDEKIFAKCDAKSSNLTLSTFGRYLIPELIAEDKVLYLDCDIFVRSTLAPLWQEDIENYYVAGIPDYNVIRRGKLKERLGKDFEVKNYVNAGVLLINNKRWREERLFKKLLDFSEEKAPILQFGDQDAINYICRSAKKILPERYNVMGYLYKPDLFADHPRLATILQERTQPVIRHFHAWKKNYFAPHRDEYISLMRQSPWANKLPQDDPKILAWIKIVGTYLWRHPFCFLLPKFYKRWYYRGAACLFLDY